MSANLIRSWPNTPLWSTWNNERKSRRPTRCSVLGQWCVCSFSSTLLPFPSPTLSAGVCRLSSPSGRLRALGPKTTYSGSHTGLCLAFSISWKPSRYGSFCIISPSTLHSRPSSCFGSSCRNSEVLKVCTIPYSSRFLRMPAKMGRAPQPVLQEMRPPNRPPCDGTKRTVWFRNGVLFEWE